MRRVGDLAIDLGTANTLVYQHGAGIVFDEPSVVAMDGRSGEVLAIGEHAWEMIGRTPSRIVAVRPLRRGAITDYEVTSQMIRHILRRVGVTRFSRPRTLICVPSAVTEVERRAVRDATTSAGARSVSLIEEPMAAAIGAGLPVHEPLGNLVVDVGGGTSEVAMLSLGGIISQRSIRVGGFDMDEAVQQHLRRVYGLAIGERASEKLKIAIGSAYPVGEGVNAEIQGREITSGMPKAVQITPEELRETLGEPVNAIVASVRECLSESDPELGHDVLERGMFLTGGGGMLAGLDIRLSQECEVPVHLTDQPLQTVVLGAGRCLELLSESAGLFAETPWLR
jgi:rod shape-determining protein MreB and related proteins